MLQFCIYLHSFYDFLREKMSKSSITKLPGIIISMANVALTTTLDSTFEKTNSVKIWAIDHLHYKTEII